MHNTKGSLAYRFCPQETSILHFSRDPPPTHPPTHLGNVKNIYRYFWQRYRFLMFLISELRYTAAIKIVSTKHKVVCAQNLVSDTILLYKQYKFCEKQKELTDKCQTKVILYPFPRCFQDKCRIFPRRVTDKRHSRQPSPYHHHHHL